MTKEQLLCEFTLVLEELKLEDIIGRENTKLVFGALLLALERAASIGKTH